MPPNRRVPPKPTPRVDNIGRRKRLVTGRIGGVSADYRFGSHASADAMALDLGDVDIAEARPVTAPPGGTRLLDSNKGTLLAIAPREGFEDAVLGFDLYSTDHNGDQTPNTNWPIRRSFPAFVFAVLNYLGGDEGVQAGESVKPGQPITLHSDAPVDQLQVRSPPGAPVNVPSGRRHVPFQRHRRPRPLRSARRLKTVERFTVNLFDPTGKQHPAGQGTIDSNRPCYRRRLMPVTSRCGRKHGSGYWWLDWPFDCSSGISTIVEFMCDGLGNRSRKSVR